MAIGEFSIQNNLAKCHRQNQQEERKLRAKR